MQNAMAATRRNGRFPKRMMDAANPPLPTVVSTTASGCKGVDSPAISMASGPSAAKVRNTATASRLRPGASIFFQMLYGLSSLAARTRPRHRGASSSSFSRRVMRAVRNHPAAIKHPKRMSVPANTGSSRHMIHVTSRPWRKNANEPSTKRRAAAIKKVRRMCMAPVDEAWGSDVELPRCVMIRSPVFAVLPQGRTDLRRR